MRGLLGMSAICVVCGCAASPPRAVAPSLPALPAPDRSLDVFERAPSPREVIPPPPADNWRAMRAPDPPAPATQPPAKAVTKPPVVSAPILTLSPVAAPSIPKEPTVDPAVGAAAQCRSGANACETAHLTSEERGTCHVLCGNLDYDRIAKSALESCVESVASSWGVQTPVCSYALPAAPSPEKRKVIERLEAAAPTCEKTCWERARVIWNRELDPLDVKSGGL